MHRVGRPPWSGPKHYDDFGTPFVERMGDAVPLPPRAVGTAVECAKREKEIILLKVPNNKANIIIDSPPRYRVVRAPNTGRFE